MAAPLLGLFLVSAVAPLAKRVLVALGIGVVSYAGLSAVYTQIQSAVLGAWGQIGGSTLQILSLAGVPEAIGITLAALSARVALVALERLGRV